MLSSLDLNNIGKVLQKAQLDEAVGIKTVKLTGNDNLAFYAAEIAGSQKVGAHYHSQGIEIYQVIKGQGKIYIGTPKSDQEVEWQDPVNVQAGDCFSVHANQVHQLVNTLSTSLIIIFACPYSHISTDRILV